MIFHFYCHLQWPGRNLKGRFLDTCHFLGSRSPGHLNGLRLKSSQASFVGFWICSVYIFFFGWTNIFSIQRKVGGDCLPECRLVGWLVGWLASLVGFLVVWLCGSLIRSLPAWLMAWLVVWLVVWLVGCIRLVRAFASCSRCYHVLFFGRRWESASRSSALFYRSGYMRILSFLDIFVWLFEHHKFKILSFWKA